MPKHKANKDVMKQIAPYIEQGIIRHSTIAKIVNAEKNEDIISAFLEMYDLSEEKKKELWYHIIQDKWKINDPSKCFSAQHCIFMKILINNCGVLRRSDCKEIGVLSTDYKIGRSADELSEMNMIDIFVLNDRQILYVLKREFYRGVFESG